MVWTGAVGESLSKVLQKRMALIIKVPGGTLVVRHESGMVISEYSVNEMRFRSWQKMRKDWTSLTFWGSRQSWIIGLCMGPW